MTFSSAGKAHGANYRHNTTLFRAWRSYHGNCSEQKNYRLFRVFRFFSARMRGFVSYAHSDRGICDAVMKPLKAIARVYGIDEFWVDTNTPTGKCFRYGYEEAIKNSSIHVLMISTNYIWSDEIMDRELPLINEKFRMHGDLILPVILDDCLWESVIGSLLASPRDAAGNLKPLIKWRPQREGVECIGRQLAAAVGAHFKISPKQIFAWDAHA
jgi:hypothetical protein